MDNKKICYVKVKKILIILFAFICLILFFYSAYKIINRFLDKKKADDLLTNVNSLVIIEEKKTVIPDDITENTENNIEEKKFNYYYDYLNVPYISVDFSKLKEINNEVVGWINITGTSVNYPYVKTDNNAFYLNHSFDKIKNEGGWVFLDYRNEKNNQDQNTIIYAHGGNKLTLFGFLQDLYDKDEWFSNKDNHYIKISTEKYDLVYKVFSLYIIPTTNDYLSVNFSDDNEYLIFLNKLKNRSKYDFKEELNENDKIITLSTCYNKSDKLVIHGKLIKQELH